MKTRDFFILMIKLFGLYSLVITVFTFIPNTFSYWLSSFMYEDYFMGIIAALMTAFMLVLVYVLMKKAGKIVDFLKIEQGFEVEEINLGSLSEAGIVKIAFIILGTYLFIDELPYFIHNTLSSLKIESYEEYIVENQPVNFAWLFSLVKVFAGLFLMFNYKVLQERLFKKKEEQI